MVSVGSVHKALEMQARLTPKRAKSRAKPMHHSVPAWSPPARNLNISSAHFERASRGSHVSPARSMQCLPSGLGLRTLRPLRPLRPCMLARPAVPSLCSLFSTPACSQSYTIPTPLSRWQSPSPQSFQPFQHAGMLAIVHHPHPARRRQSPRSQSPSPATRLPARNRTPSPSRTPGGVLVAVPVSRNTSPASPSRTPGGSPRPFQQPFQHACMLARPAAVPPRWQSPSPATRRPCVDVSFDGLNKIYILNILPFHTKNTTARARLAEA